LSNDADIHVLQGFHEGDPKGLAIELRKGLARGDFIGLLVRARVRWLLWQTERRVMIEEGQTPHGVALRQARAAEHSAVAAWVALVISIVSLGVAALAYFRPPA
jgi:hypothetical protein